MSVVLTKMDTSCWHRTLESIMGCAYIDEYITALEQKAIQINPWWKKHFKLFKQTNAN